MQKEILMDLARSGLTAADAKTMRVVFQSEARNKKDLSVKHPGYRIPYPDLKGRNTKFYRVRLFASGFEAALRYRQPKGTDVRLYFPPVGNKWGRLAADVKTPLYITEGEKKAFCAMKKGLPCVGLGGVWSWASKKKNIALISDFDLVVWSGRAVYIVFDSDMASNDDIRKAADRLGDTLKARGASVTILQLPEGPEGAKVGLDDWLLRNNPSALKNLGAGESADSKILWKLNEEVAIVKSAGGLYHFPTKRFQKEEFLGNAVYSHLYLTNQKDDKALPAFKFWLKWPHRRMHEGIVYAPGEPLVTKGNDLNLWHGLKVEPAPGNVKPWVALLDYIFEGNVKSRKWFEQWLAYPLQNPGAKLYTMVLLWSRQEGVGKSLVGYVMKEIYGDNFAEVSQEELHSDYNAWAENKQFALGEELTGSDRRRDFDRLKHMVTRSAITVNAKYQPHYSIRDCINYLLNSNNPNALLMSDTDRRCFIHEIKAEKQADSFYAEIDKWYKKPDGPAALLHYMLHLDMAGFNPKAEAPMTHAKNEMLSNTRSPLMGWLRSLYEYPEKYLVVGSLKLTRDIFTAEEVRGMVPEAFNYTPAYSTLAPALRRAGFDSPRRIEGSVYWVLRNNKKWEKAADGEWLNHHASNGLVVKSEKSGKVVSIKRKKEARK